MITGFGSTLRMNLKSQYNQTLDGVIIIVRTVGTLIVLWFFYRYVIDTGLYSLCMFLAISLWFLILAEISSFLMRLLVDRVEGTTVTRSVRYDVLVRFALRWYEFFRVVCYIIILVILPLISMTYAWLF